MTIDRTKLVELLVEKTSLAREEVAVQLDQLIERIIDAAERGKALEIKEFGLFFFDQEGELKFEPSEELSTEISFKYAGMKPVELKPERNTAILLDDDQLSTVGGDDVIVIPKSDQKSTPKKPQSTTQPTPKKVKKSISRKPIREKKDRSAVWALLAFFTVLMVGALIYFNRPMDPVSEGSLAISEPAPQGSEFMESPEDEPLAGGDEENGEESSDGEQIEEQINETTVPIQDQLYGLTGEPVEEANSGYSIVVHSFYNELRADQVAENLRADGYRVQITERIVGGIEVWRVSLGQFESISDAQEAAETLPQPYNENNFIQRIQQQ
jgi:nucleoid DNA-binding protein